MAKREIMRASFSGVQIPVMAEVYGPFAVHASVDRWSYFTVTHIPTGYSVVQDANTAALAMSLARRLVRLGVRWDFDTVEKYPQRARRLTGDCVSRWRAETAASGRAPSVDRQQTDVRGAGKQKKARTSR